MKTRIFLQKGLDRQITDLPSGKSVRHSGMRRLAQAMMRNRASSLALRCCPATTH
jgi:hypothetical protein